MRKHKVQSGHRNGTKFEKDVLPRETGKAKVTLYERRARGDFIMIFKAVSGLG